VPVVTGEAYLSSLYVFYILYNAIGFTWYGLQNDFVAITTRDLGERTTIQFYRKLSLTLISGILIGLVLMSVVYYQFLINNQRAWQILIIGVSVFAFPLVFVEYFWLKERVTEDSRQRESAMHHSTTSYPLGAQFKALFTDKYYIMMFIYTLLQAVLETMKGGNVMTNYNRWVLGANAENNIHMLYQIASGVPTGVGAIIAYPLAKRLGVRRFSIIGFAIAAFAGVFGLLFSADMIPSIVAGFVKNIGLIPFAYVTITLFACSLDSVEYRTGMRLNGMMSIAIIGVVNGIVLAPIGALYETILIASGFNAQLPVQPEAVTNWVSFVFWGIDIISAVMTIIILAFYDIDKKLPAINAELERRREEALGNK
jgi:GPH family glycoside/pentoside/hexuronide:cation symporter